MDVLRVSAKSSPHAVAGAISGILRQKGEVSIHVIGAGAVNQAIKSLAIARDFVQPDGIDPIFVASFHELEIDGQARTAIRLVVEDRAHAGATLATIPDHRDGDAGHEDMVSVGSMEVADTGS